MKLANGENIEMSKSGCGHTMQALEATEYI